MNEQKARAISPIQGQDNLAKMPHLSWFSDSKPVV